MHELLQILQIYIGARESLDAPLSDAQWEETLKEAGRQSLMGIFDYVVQRMSPPFKPPLRIWAQSLFFADKIARKNTRLDEHCREITDRLHSMSLECCILKGQSYARLYPEPSSRVCGDIDIWVGGKVRGTLSAVRKMGKTGTVYYHHTSMRPFNDRTVLEVHFRPTWMNNPFTNRKLQAFFSSVFPNPGSSFNCVFCAVHIYRHLLSEGVGLRQIMDYYYVLRFSTAQDRELAAGVLSTLKMRRFMGALMYVLQEWFIMDREFLFMLPDRKYGSFLMNEIRLSGNFGRTDDRYDIKYTDPAPVRGAKKLSRLSHYVTIAPSEVLWAPYFKAWQYVWRLFNR